uniref:Prolactin-releasing peptide n=2 Tax=unclassified Caudoviricetes TaxID=2788787 RepID=A0A8S5QKC7_9CAUD|nr:MAG TPA: Prolactin-releasing peptide [Siphoviridae sp. ct58g5]DAF88692.1 MAG TPA: Prolactin-releasing peptide [Siphoviridae sp. ctxD432]
MVTIDCFWYNRGVYLLDRIGHRIRSRCINEERK